MEFPLSENEMVVIGLPLVSFGVIEAPVLTFQTCAYPSDASLNTAPIKLLLSLNVAFVQAMLPSIIKTSFSESD